MTAMAELWQAMLDHAKTEFPEIWTEERCVWLALFPDSPQRAEPGNEASVWGGVCMWGGKFVAVLCIVCGQLVMYLCV